MSSKLTVLGLGGIIYEMNIVCLVSWFSPASLWPRRPEPRQWRHGLALRHDQADCRMRCISGSVIGIARILSVRPSVSASFVRHHAGPAPGPHMGELRTIIELDSSVGAEPPPACKQKIAVNDPPVLHIRRQQAERDLPRPRAQVTLLAIAERAVRRQSAKR